MIIGLVIMDLIHIRLHSHLRIIYSGVSCIADGSPCGVWCRGLTISMPRSYQLINYLLVPLSLTWLNFNPSMDK